MVSGLELYIPISVWGITYYFYLSCTVDSPPLKKPKVESSSPKPTHSNTPNSNTSSSSTTSNPCFSSNGHTNIDTSLSSINNSLPPPSSSLTTPSSSLSQQQKSQVPQSHPSSHGGIMPNNISNHITQQVPINSTSANIKSTSDSRGNMLPNHQTIMTQLNTGPVQNSSGFNAPTNIVQPLQTDTQQQPQNNNDVSFKDT